jgi:uncharacterized membrane protein YhaH (DUF805 family)
MNSTMTPIDWAKRPIQKYADFTGRAPRAEYWWFVLAMVIIFVALTIVESIVGLNKMVFGVYGPLTTLLWLAVLVPSLSVGVRRLHDTNRSGWWLLLMVPYAIGGVLMVRSMSAAAAAGTVPGFGAAGILMLIGFVCVIVLLLFYCLAGTPGDNRYGPNPYG